MSAKISLLLGEMQMGAGSVMLEARSSPL